MLSIINDEDQADQVEEIISLQEIERWTSSNSRFDSEKDLITTSIKNTADELAVIGFSRFGLVYRIEKCPAL